MRVNKKSAQSNNLFNDIYSVKDNNYKYADSCKYQVKNIHSNRKKALHKEIRPKKIGIFVANIFLCIDNTLQYKGLQMVRYIKTSKINDNSSNPI